MRTFPAAEQGENGRRPLDMQDGVRLLGNDKLNEIDFVSSAFGIADEHMTGELHQGFPHTDRSLATA